MRTFLVMLAIAVFFGTVGYKYRDADVKPIAQERDLLAGCTPEKCRYVLLALQFGSHPEMAKDMNPRAAELLNQPLPPAMQEKERQMFEEALFLIKKRICEEARPGGALAHLKDERIELCDRLIVRPTQVRK